MSARDQLRLLDDPPSEKPQRRERRRSRRPPPPVAPADEEPFYFVPVDRYGRQLRPILANDPVYPEHKQWHAAALFCWLAAKRAEERPPGWLAWQTWPC